MCSRIAVPTLDPDGSDSSLSSGSMGPPSDLEAGPVEFSNLARLRRSSEQCINTEQFQPERSDDRSGDFSVPVSHLDSVAGSLLAFECTSGSVKIVIYTGAIASICLLISYTVCFVVGCSPTAV